MEQYYDAIHRRLTNPLQLYDAVEFNKPDLLLNAKSPPPLVAITIGVVILLIYLNHTRQRFNSFSEQLNTRYSFDASSWSQRKKTRLQFVRTSLAAAMDSDDHVHTMMYHFAIGFIFLGFFQLNYEGAYYSMLIYNAIVSCGDMVQVYLAYREYGSLQDLISRSPNYILRDSDDKHEEAAKVDKAEYNFEPANVYQNIARESLVVIMVFITQVVFILFVAIDTVVDGTTEKCMTDGTEGCPTVGTLASWILYIFGIFLQCVYLLGPRTKFGQSQLNPVYWLCLLLANKNRATALSWSAGQANIDGLKVIRLREQYYSIMYRLFATTLINGFGFRLLVNTLPIQFAGQSSLMSLIFRSVGMMYLVNLDDSTGVKFQLKESLLEVGPGAKKDRTDSVEEGNAKDDENTVEQYHFRYDLHLGLLYNDDGKDEQNRDFLQMKKGDSAIAEKKSRDSLDMSNGGEVSSSLTGYKQRAPSLVSKESIDDEIQGEDFSA